MKSKNEINLIISKFLSGTATMTESEAFLQWLNQSKENRQYYFIVKRIWFEDYETEKKEKILESAFERLKIRTVLAADHSVTCRKKINTLKKLSVAATLLILLGISFFLCYEIYNIYEFEQTVHEISTPKGGRTSLTLPDGTKVWLNSGSSLTYKAGFGRTDRNVFLEGEAFFDVQTHSNKHFTVNTSDMDVRVLGTQLNVKSYPEDELTETTLLKGKAEVNIVQEGKVLSSVVVSPDQRAMYSRNVDTLYLQNVEEAAEYSSWKEGRLVFRSEALSNIARDLERFYNVEIYFKNESAKDIRFSGTLEEVSIEAVLRAIERVSPITYEVEKNQIYLKKST